MVNKQNIESTVGVNGDFSQPLEKEFVFTFKDRLVLLWNTLLFFVTGNRDKYLKHTVRGNMSCYFGNDGDLTFSYWFKLPGRANPQHITVVAKQYITTSYVEGQAVYKSVPLFFANKFTYHAEAYKHPTDFNAPLITYKIVNGVGQMYYGDIAMLKG